jgi:mannitol-1-/sugar-/sorbitol-6-phosphatase
LSMTQRFAEAILFDLDGTLVDSTASVERNWRRLAARTGWSFGAIEPLIHGIPGKQVLRMIDPDMPEELVEELNEFMIVGESTDTDDCIPLPGALTALDELPTTRWAIVTSGSRRLAAARIAAAGLPRPRFLVTADDVPQGKPHPDPYLLGAELVGRAPGRCLVFEDAPAGLESAAGAGIPVVGLLTTHRALPVPSVGTLADVEFSADRTGVIVTY